MPIIDNKRHYDFRILLETNKGKQFSYISSSFFNENDNTNFALSSSDAWHRMTGSLSCSFQNTFTFDSSGYNPYKTDKTFKDDNFMSSSLSGSLESGSVIFYTKGLTGGDKLKRYKFIGEKCCTAMGLPHNVWQFTDEFRLVSGNERHFFKGDVLAESLHVVNNMAISNAGTMDSDLPIKVSRDTDRFIKFVEASSSKVPKSNLVLGYHDKYDEYIISASNDVTFRIGGVDSLEVTSITSSYTTSSVTETVTNIELSGDSKFGDDTNDFHQFTGSVNLNDNLELKNNKYVRWNNTNAAASKKVYMHSNDGVFAIKNVYGGGGLSGWFYTASGSKASIGRHAATAPVDGLTVVGNISASTTLYATDGVFGQPGTTAASTLTVKGGISSSSDLFMGDTGGNFVSWSKGGTFKINMDDNVSNERVFEISVDDNHIFSIDEDGDISASGDFEISTGTPTLTLYETSNGAKTTINQVSGHLQMANLYDNTAGDLELRTVGFNNAVYIDNSAASLGVGTDTPAKTLTVAGDVSASNFWSGRNFSMGSPLRPSISSSGDIYLPAGQYISWTGQHAERNTSIREMGYDLYVKSDKALYIQSGQYLDNGHLILNNSTDDDRRVGIGTGAPAKTLTVGGDISASGGFFSENSASIGTATQKGMFQVDYGNNAACTGSLAVKGDGYGEIVSFMDVNDAVSAGDVVVLRSLTHGWVVADKDTEWQTANWMGVAMQDGDSGNRVLIKGFVRLGIGHIADSTGGEGDPLYVGADGHVTFAPTTTGGEFVRIIGYCVNEAADIIYLDPDKTWVEVAS
tara:strand:+ start:932 stop:3337 length:2406 start_codon:yes stop_codon:yes gene_type:complete